jgi:C1A family cysteine protease
MALLCSVAVLASAADRELHRRLNPLATFDGPERNRPSKRVLPLHVYPAKANKRFAEEIKGEIPSVVNWVTKGGVTPVSDQGQCGGGCVAFTVTGNVEGVNFATNGRLVPLSAQEVVSCAMQDGCCGGFMSDAINWFLQNTNGKICTAASFPYNSSNGIPQPCNTKCTTGAQVTEYVTIASSETAMAQSVAMSGPISVGVDAESWELYSGGVLTNCTNNQVDHSAVIVGYNDVHNPPYWLIKNSWGSTWGENGYIRVAKGSNQCGITSMPSTVRVHRNS